MKGNADEPDVTQTRTFELALEIYQMIDDYQHGNRLPSRIAAVRQMLTEAYAAWAAKVKPR